MNNLKAIFFDADDTLLDFDEHEKQALIYLCDRIGVSYKDEYQGIFGPLDLHLWANASYNGIPVPVADIATYRFQILFELIGVEYDDYAAANALFMEGLKKQTALTKNAEKITEYLHNKGLLLCVVTNGLIELQKPRVLNGKVGKFISYVIVSEEVKAHKPSPLIFRALLDRLSLTSNDVVMIGDSLAKDIQGAQNAGIKTIWYNPKRAENETNIIPDFEVNDLLQIASII